MVPEKVEEVLFFDLEHTKNDFQIATLNRLIWSLHSCTLLTNEVVTYFKLGSLYYLSHTGSISLCVCFYCECQKWKENLLWSELIAHAVQKFINIICMVISASVYLNWKYSQTCSSDHLYKTTTHLRQPLV